MQEHFADSSSLNNTMIYRLLRITRAARNELRKKYFKCKEAAERDREVGSSGINGGEIFRERQDGGSGGGGDGPAEGGRVLR